MLLDQEFIMYIDCVSHISDGNKSLTVHLVYLFPMPLGIIKYNEVISNIYHCFVITNVTLVHMIVNLLCH